MYLKDNRIVKAAFIAALAALAAISVFQGIKNAMAFSQDLQWDAAKALAMRLDPYELSRSPGEASRYPELAGFYELFTDKGLKQDMEANQFPSLLALLLPLTFLPPYAARLVWTTCSLLFTAGIVFLLKRTFFEETGRYAYAAITLLMLAGTPYRNQIGVGQHTLFSFFFFMLAVYIDRRMEKGISCVLISLCLFVSYFKYTLTGVLALYFVYRKRYKELIISVLAHVLLTMAASAWIGKSFLYMITAPLGVASALSSSGGIDFGTFLGRAWPMAAAAVLAVLLFMAVKLPENMEGAFFAVLTLWSLVLVYHRTYDMFVLTAASAFFCKKYTSEKVRLILFIWYALLILTAYFILRIFSENSESMIAFGMIYYSFAAAVTYFTYKGVPERYDER
ncbi:MAG: glycosyltransferase 87 family protein [Lachnospiraceae bacterium]|nr:glycosyltransferase 87 family protein [Lachnospiraceae bacterium]